MRREDRYLDTLRCLASMPFLDRLELAAVSGMADRTAYNAVADLKRRGLVDAFSHATDLLRTTRRFYVTAAGLGHLASVDAVSLDRVLRHYTVSAQWRRILLERLDAVGVIYRLVATIAAEEGTLGFRWFRTGPLDAAITLPGNRTIGIVRQGATSDRTAFAKRLWRLREGQLPGAILLLAPDSVRLHHMLRLLSGAPISAFLALEEDAAMAGCDDPVWHPPSIAASLDLRYVLSRMDPGGILPADPELSRATLPQDIALDGQRRAVPDHLLPAMLKPAEKHALDVLSDWPWITPPDLCRLLGFSKPRLSQVMVPLTAYGLIRRLSIGGSRHRPSGSQGPSRRWSGQKTLEYRRRRGRRGHFRPLDRHLR